MLLTGLLCIAVTGGYDNGNATEGRGGSIVGAPPLYQDPLPAPRRPRHNQNDRGFLTWAFTVAAAACVRRCDPSVSRGNGDE